MALADEPNIKEYLLGQLNEAEEEQLELRLLTDPDFAEEYDIVVNEITDDYTAGKFEGKELERVEQHFFKSMVRQDKLRFTLALNDYSTTANPSASNPRQLRPGKSWLWALRVAASISVVAIMVGTFWLFRQGRSSPRTFATLTLTVSKGERGEGPRQDRVRLPINADALRIALQLVSSPQLETAVRYRVEMENDSGEKKMLESNVPDRQSVTVVIPAAELKRGQYSLKVFAVRADGTEQRIPGNYLFTVE